jgi:hypothetical protein
MTIPVNAMLLILAAIKSKDLPEPWKICCHCNSSGGLLGRQFEVGHLMCGCEHTLKW